MMTALRMGLFEAVPHDMSSIAVTELGASTGADPVLISMLVLKNQRGVRALVLTFRYRSPDESSCSDRHL